MIVFDLACDVRASVYQLPFYLLCECPFGDCGQHMDGPKDSIHLFIFLHVFLYLFFSITNSFFFKEKLSSL